MKEKVLYLEGCGCAEYNGINCCCTTVVKSPRGLLYVEVSGFPLSYRQKKYFKEYHGKKAVPIPLYMDVSIYEKDGEWRRLWKEKDGSWIKFPDKSVSYTLENICLWINKICKTDFDRVQVLPYYAGYHTIDSTKKGIHRLQRGDTFHYQPRITERRRKKIEKLMELHKEEFHEKYDNTSYWVGDDKKLHMRFGVSDEALKQAGYIQRECIVEV